MTKIINGLIPHFYSSGKLIGSATVCGETVAEIEMYRLAETIGNVFQNPKSQFFYMDFTAEISFGLENKGVSPEEIRNIITKVKEELGIEHLLGRNIFRLSGGEKQRISIARAILKNAPIIILDESTASIDPENEHLIQAALSVLTKEKTVIVIAHRLVTIESADQIVVLKEGKIEQIGTHAELSAVEGTYKEYKMLREKAERWTVGNTTSH